MGVIIPGDFKVVHIKRDFALNVFVLTRFHCISLFLSTKESEEVQLPLLVCVPCTLSQQSTDLSLCQNHWRPVE